MDSEQVRAQEREAFERVLRKYLHGTLNNAEDVDNVSTMILGHAALEAFKMDLADRGLLSTV